MPREVGLWIDHHKTVIVTVEDEVEETREIRSNMEKHVRSNNSTRPKEHTSPRGATAEDIRNRKSTDQQDRYYEGVISFIRNADSIWIIGPGEAKVELETRLKHTELGGRIVGVEVMNKMTDQQIVDKVKVHYQIF